MVLLLLAAALLWSSFSGRSGVQVLSEAAAARIFALHQHGLPGEAEYVATHGVSAPFVPRHCHTPLSTPDAQPGPYEVQAAASLGSGALCAGGGATPAAPAVLPSRAPREGVIPEGRALAPPVRPPR